MCPLRSVSGFVRRLLALVCALTWLLSGPAHAAAGFQDVAIPGRDDAPALTGGIWYPAAPGAIAGPLAIGPWPTLAARDAALRRGAGRLPLVLLVHGAGGSIAEHAALGPALALAEGGFIAAGITNLPAEDADAIPLARVADRARQVSRLLDHLLATPAWREAIDPERIGAFGYSAGGTAVLVLVGGQPEAGLFRPFCQAEPRHRLCESRFGLAVIAAADTGRRAIFPRDPRIRAVVLAAPALGFLFDPDGLRAVPADIPVQLWRPEEDVILPHPHHGGIIARLLPGAPDYRPVARAGHFAFLPPCAPGFAATNAMLCEDAPGFDRVAFQRDYFATVTAFFSAGLARR